MITVRQLERLWESKSFARMSALLLEMRPESSPRLVHESARATPAAALAVIRLEELSQAYTPFCARMIRTLLACQEGDGGWTDALTTALSIRALSCCDGHGLAIEHALTYLAKLQKEDGSWPRIPLRRLPGDAFTTAAVLFYLSDHHQFTRTASTFHEEHLDSDTLKLFRSRRLHPSPTPQQRSLVWS